MSIKIFAKRSKAELSFDLELSQANHKFDSVESKQNEFILKGNGNGDSVTISEGTKDLATIKTETIGNEVTISLVITKPDTTDTDPLKKATISLVLT